MMSDSEEVIFGNAAKKLKIFCSESDEKYDEILRDSPQIDRIIDSKSTSTSNNNIYVISDDDTNEDNLFKLAEPKIPDYPSGLSNECETERFLSTHRNATKRQKCKQSKKLSLKKKVTNKPGKVIKTSDTNTDNSPLKSVRTKRKPTKRKTKPPQDALSQPLLERVMSQVANQIQNFCDPNVRFNLSESIDAVQTSVSPNRRRSKRLRHTSRNPQYTDTSQIPTYSIGNTENYFDKSEEIPLFRSKPKILDEIIILDNDSNDEKVTVNVNWQNFEVFKFHLHPFENLSQIYDYFAKKENVTYNRLYFAYNDVVLTCDDSPESIKYKIATFIEGGLNSPDIVNLVRDDYTSKPSGILIKFQMQNFKRPYELAVPPNEKLSYAMTKCAEHFEKPLYNLKFEFDGEPIIGSTTAKELDLENGDCIDGVMHTILQQADAADVQIKPFNKFKKLIKEWLCIRILQCFRIFRG